jgi:hypothetical protein
MLQQERFRLHFGPYRASRFRLGSKVTCAVRGEVVIRAVSDAPIAWPLGWAHGGLSLVVYAGLEQAIRRESIQAVAHHWGVTPQTVTKWRGRLGIQGSPVEGTTRLRKRYAAEPWAEQARLKAWSKAQDPERRARIAAAKRGKPRSPDVVAAMRERMRGKRPTEAARERMRQAALRAGRRLGR